MPQLQYPPLPPNTVVEQKRINIDPSSLFKGEKKKQVKKHVELKPELEKRIREMDAQKRKQKLAERESNGKKIKL